MVNANPAWDGDVAAFMVNQAGAEAGIDGCGSKASLPMLQEGVGDPLRTVFSAGYNAVAVIDDTTRLYQVLSTGVTGDPEALAAAVNDVLGL
jgi:hypothetical protein